MKRKHKPDTAWQTLFKVRLKENYVDDGDIRSHTTVTWDVINIHNDQVVGNYRDENYARKQAKRKYKKLVRLMEKSFMSV